MFQNKKTRVNLNLGFSSLLLIFVVLSLVSFSVLSLSTALSDKKLTQQTVDKNIAYYSACNEAQQFLEEYDKKFISIYQSTNSKTDYLSLCERELSPIIIPVNEYHNLQVTITPVYPESSGDSFYQISSWQVVLSSEPNLDLSINIIK